MNNEQTMHVCMVANISSVLGCFSEACQTSTGAQIIFNLLYWLLAMHQAVSCHMITWLVTLSNDSATFWGYLHYQWDV